MFYFNTVTGELKHDGLHLGFGYSGRGDDKLKQASENIPMRGPIPRGLWTIGPAYEHPVLGPIVMNLDPSLKTNTFGRSLFRIHGDSIEHPGDASDGCIVLQLTLRKIVAASGDRALTVL